MKKNEISNLIKVLAGKKNLSIVDLSIQLGLSRNTLHFYNSGHTVSIGELALIARIFGHSYEDVVWEYRENFKRRISDPVKIQIAIDKAMEERSEE